MESSYILDTHPPLKKFNKCKLKIKRKLWLNFALQKSAFVKNN